jgi:hypothetical protein
MFRLASLIVALVLLEPSFAPLLGKIHNPANLLEGLGWCGGRGRLKRHKRRQWLGLGLVLAVPLSAPQMLMPGTPFPIEASDKCAYGAARAVLVDIPPASRRITDTSDLDRTATLDTVAFAGGESVRRRSC